MKVCVVSGSNNKQSNTLKIVKALLNENLKTQKLNIVVHDFSNLDLKYCNGCFYCRKYGECILSSEDKIEEIKSDMLESDLLVFCSPVYVNSISGKMKTFIDRIHVWTHMMPLIGKKGIAITSCGTRDCVEPVHYLKDILLFLGVDVIWTENFCVYDFVEYERISKEIAYRMEERKIFSSEQLEKNFQSMKFGIQQAKDILLESGQDSNLEEINYWYRTGNAFCSSFEEASRRHSSNK